MKSRRDEPSELSAELRTLLAQVDIDSPHRLKEIGAVEAYVAIHRRGLNPALSLLYALEAVVRNVHWTQLPHQVRASLTLEADALIAADQPG